VRHFEAYLTAQGKTLETVTPNDIRNSPRGNYLALGMYYEFLSDERLSAAAHEAFSAPNFTAFKLNEFMGIRPETVQTLKAHGIVTAKDMLEAGRTPASRASLAQETGLPAEEILELVKLSDQARIGGHKRVRARLFHEAGLDTLDKIAACEPEEIRRIQIEYIRRTDFKGIPSTPREAANSVKMARYLPRIVEY
jgi:predicted flap endonuclease-1-like 5' DNA nuclease